MVTCSLRTSAAKRRGSRKSAANGMTRHAPAISGAKISHTERSKLKVVRSRLPFTAPTFQQLGTDFQVPGDFTDPSSAVNLPHRRDLQVSAVESPGQIHTPL